MPLLYNGFIVPPNMGVNDLGKSGLIEVPEPTEVPVVPKKAPVKRKPKAPAAK